MIDIVDRLRFDSVRCETQFSKGVAANIDEAIREIEQLRDVLRYVIAEGDHVSRWVLADKAKAALTVASDQCRGEK